MTKEPTDKEPGPVPEPPMTVEEVARLTNLQSTLAIGWPASLRCATRHLAKLLKVEPPNKVDPAGD